MWSLFVVAALIAPQAQQGTGGAAAARSALPDLQARVAAMIANRPDPLELTLAAPVQLPNGRQVGASVRPAAGAEPWFVYSRGNLCQSVITRGPAPTDAADGWKVTVIERSRTTTHVTVGVTWFRLWERGLVVTSGSGGTNELTLQRGDRIPLDTITRPSAPGVCAGTMKSLDLQVGAPMFSTVAPAGETTLDAIVDAELWMVHQAPNGTETVEHQTVRLIAGAVGFGFRSAPIETTDGPVSIELMGQLKAVRREDNSRGLWSGLTRIVTRQSTAGIAYANTTSATVGWLTPGEVVSLDLPPLQMTAGAGLGRGGGSGGSGGGRGGAVVSRGGGAVVSTGRITPSQPNLLEGHRLSLRVRLVESR